MQSQAEYVSSPRSAATRAGRLVVALTAVAALVLSACGGDDGAATVDTTTTTTTTVATTLPPTTAPPTTTAPPPPTTTAPPPPPKPAAPSCDTETLLAVFNEGVDPSNLYGAGSDDGPKCDGDVAVLFVSQDDIGDGNPDFGTAVFVARNGRWTSIARYRTAFAEMLEEDPEFMSATSPDQRRRVFALLEG